MIKTVKNLPVDLLRWIYWYPFRIMIQHLSFSNINRLAKLIGNLVCVFSFRRREIITRELVLSLDEYLPRQRISSIVRQSFQNFYQTQLEVFLYPRLNPDRIKEMVLIEGKENIELALKHGKGVILLFSHFGANQMIMPAIGYNGYKMNQLSGSARHWLKIMPERASLIYRKILELKWNYEYSLPVQHIDVFGSLKPVIRCLRNNEILGIAMDGGGGKKKLALNFLGRRAYFSSGSIDIARHTNAVVLPTFIVRKPDGGHRLIIHKQINFNGFDVQHNIKKFLTLLESYIKRYPCHYAQFLWLARKFTMNTETPFFADYADITD